MSLALLTDLYQLTMAYGYWRAGKARQDAVFQLYFRREPFGGAYAIAAGLEPAIEYLQSLSFTRSDLDYLATLHLFDDAFLDFLGGLRFTCDVDAIPEGTVVFAYEPLLRVRGSILEAQIVETALLNFLNFQTLIATKAQRIVHAAAGDPVIDFGLRRAQGEDGALAATRAAYIGGVSSTSNVLAGAMYGIPVKGTHAHSWVMSFDSELEAFETYAEVMPSNVLLLVDTYDTLEGVKHAIEVGRKLRERGHELLGIRLDSGDLTQLSQQARAMLDDAGFPKAVIAASNDLDEHAIAELKQRGAKIALWGVGTRLVTAWDQPALGGVYKLAAVRDPRGEWQRKMKRSAGKKSIPGILNVRRTADGDVIYDELRTPSAGDDLLVPIMRGGRVVYERPSLNEIAAHRAREFARFPEAMKRLENPERWPVAIEASE
jgi:nicotinate phosphoribosyltransferase